MKVDYVAHSGDDLLVVNAARASFGKESHYIGCADAVYAALIATNKDKVGDVDLAYEKYVNDNAEDWMVNEGSFLTRADFGLLDFLAREKHILPFRHPQITLRCKAPIFLARQLGKHQVGMSWSEESRRYITTEPEFYWPDKWRKKADNVKQGSSDEVVPKVWWTDAENWYTPEEGVREVVQFCTGRYNDMLRSGVAPELARMILPQNMYVVWVWTGSLLSFYQLYKLRAEAHAQKEARDFAEMIKAEVSKLYPESWAALERHV